MNPRKEAGIALLACVGGASLTLFAASRPWADGQAVQGSLRAPLEVSGGSLAPAVPALGLAALAGALAVLATRCLGRVLVGVALGACGIVLAVLAVRGLDPSEATLADRAGDALGTATATADGGGTAWPWLAVLGGLLIVGAGTATAWRGRSWPAMSARYDKPVDGTVPPTDRAADPADRPAERTTEGDGALEQWRAMDRGDDPTLR